LGRHIVETLSRDGHDATLFHRGETNPELFPERAHVLGDRATDLARLGDARFDAVIDTSGYLPAGARASAGYLATRAEFYVFVSSVSVYDTKPAFIDETSPRVTLPEGAPSDVLDLQYYGALKALCEDAVVHGFGRERTAIVRPGLIVGPYDPTDRYTYWVARIARGGDVLAPAGPQTPLQYVDARDLAEWIARLCETRRAGTFNAVMPRGMLTLGAVLDACVEASGSGARLVWAGEEFLCSNGIEGWMDMPLWVPERLGEQGFMNVDTSRAIAAGLRSRPPLETARDTLAWLPERPDRPWKTGLAPEHEAELLRALV
jgi:2'-hydroxyisoflavone reductase